MTHVNVDRKRLIEAVRRLRNKRILVLGDIILDRFIWGVVSRISPEAPVPVVEVRKETVCLGGAANVSANVKSLGGIPLPVGVVGRDGEGHDIREKFRSLRIPTRSLAVDSQRATTVKTRIIAHHQQVCRADREDRSPLAETVERRVIAKFQEQLHRSDAVVISDYAKGMLTPSLLKNILQMARAAKKVVCVDPKKSNLSMYLPATVITPNSLEAENASGISIHDERSLERAGREILRRTEVPHLLITRGEEGMALFEEDERVTHIPTVAREVFDVTGAGDTVISTLALGIVAGLSILEAAVLSNYAAGIVVGKLGTACVSPDELIARIQELR